MLIIKQADERLIETLSFRLRINQYATFLKFMRYLDPFNLTSLDANI